MEPGTTRMTCTPATPPVQRVPARPDWRSLSVATRSPAASGCTRCCGRVVAGRLAQPSLACIDSPRLLTPKDTDEPSGGHVPNRDPPITGQSGPSRAITGLSQNLMATGGAFAKEERDGDYGPRRAPRVGWSRSGGPRGCQAGSIVDLYVDEQTKQPTWGLVRTGLLGSRQTLVPLDQATVPLAVMVSGAGSVQVPFESAAILDAPSVAVGEEISEGYRDRAAPLLRPRRPSGAGRR